MFGSEVGAYITGVFYVIFLGVIAHYLWRKTGSYGNRINFRPLSFLLLAYLSLFIGGAFTLLTGPKHALIGVTLGGGIVLSLIHPMVAVSFFIGTLIMRPWELIPYSPFGMSVPVPKLLAGVCIVSWIFGSIRNGGIAFIWNKACMVYIFLLAWLFLAAAGSGSAGEGISYVNESFFPVTVMMLLLLNAPQEERDLGLLRTTTFLAISASILTALYVTYSQNPFGGTTRLDGAGGLFSNANDLAALICMGIPFAVFHTLRAKGVVKKGFGALCCLILLMGIWSSQSRGAMLALAIGGAVYFLLTRKPSFKQLLLMGVLGVGVLGLFSTIQREEGDLEGSSGSRWNYVVTGFRMAKDHPVFGVGPGNYEKLYEAYSGDFSEFGNRTAHSSWVLVMSEGGFIGLLLFAILFGIAVKYGWSVRQLYPEYLLSIACYGWTMTFLSHTYNFLPYLAFALALSSGRVLRHSRAQT